MPSPSTRGQHRSNNAPSNSSALTPNVASNASLACCNVTRDQWLIVLQRWKFSLERGEQLRSEVHAQTIKNPHSIYEFMTVLFRRRADQPVPIFKPEVHMAWCAQGCGAVTMERVWR